MATETQIIEEIEAKVGKSYPAWTIGFTDKPGRTREEHGNPDVWYQWHVDNKQQAQEVALYFELLDMQSGSTEKPTAEYVYIF